MECKKIIIYLQHNANFTVNIHKGAQNPFVLNIKGMRNIIFIFALILPVICQGQGHKRRNIVNYIKSGEMNMEEVLTRPDDYVPAGVSPDQIQRVEFERDTNYNNTPDVHAVIEERDGFNKVYSIGQLINYQSAETTLAYTVITTTKDGQEYRTHVVFDFSNGMMQVAEFERADYDAFGTPMYDILDNGDIIVAL